MDTRNTVAQITGALLNTGLPKVFKVAKPQTDQAITIHLDGASKLDLTAISNENVTYVRAGDRLVVLFDNHSTVTIEPFYDFKGTPLADVTLELSSDRSVSGAEFASLFPITTDQTILPVAGSGTPASGAHFETVTVDQLANSQAPLPLLGPEAPAGNQIPTGTVNISTNLISTSLGVQGPTLGVHDVRGSEDKPIALGITDALSISDPRASLGNLTITGVPAGATLSAGIHHADGSWTLTPAQLAGLTLTSDGEVQHFTLKVTAPTIENTVTTATATATFNVSVAPVADSPTLTLGEGGLTTTVAGHEDQAIALPIKAALGEVDADAVLSVTISGIPSGVTLSAGTHNADGSVTLTPAQLAGLTLTSDGETQHFDLTVTATTVDGGDTATAAASPSGIFHVNVTPVPQTPTLDTIATPASINEGATIALNLVPHFEADADARNTIIVSGLPSNATLNHGTLDPATGNYTLSQADLAGLTLTAPDDDTRQISFTVTAHASEGGIDAVSTSQHVTLAVNPVADAPALTASAAASSVNEDSTVALNISVTPVSEPGESDASTSVTISGLGTATLNHGTVNPDGSVTLQLSDLPGLTLQTADDDTLQLNLKVTATTTDGGNVASSTQTIDLAVNPVLDVGFTNPVLAASVDANGKPVIGGFQVSIDGNGAEVAFATINGQIFAKNIETGVLTLVSADANGNPAITLGTSATSAEPSIDGDGRLVAFQSNATNLAANLTGSEEIFVKNIATGQVVVASADAGGAPLAGNISDPSISADGTTVTFLNGSEVFQKNLATGALTLVSADASGNAANAAPAGSEQPAVSDNGNFVAFATTATNLTANATNAANQEIFVKNLATGAVTLASADAHGNEANAAADAPAISADGRFVAFNSSATNLTANATDGKQEVFVKDLQTGVVVLASSDANGVEGTGFVNGSASISADGRFVTFETDSPNLISQPTSGQLEVVTKDLRTGAVTLVSVDANGVAGSSDSSGVISADGRAVAVITAASNLGAGPQSEVSGERSNEFIFVKGTNVAFGAEDKPIAIPLQILEVDPDATTLTISGIPAGVTLSNAVSSIGSVALRNDIPSIVDGSVIITDAIPPIVNGSVTLTQAQLAGLTLTSDGEVPVFDLKVSGTDGGVTAAVTTIHVEVAPVPSSPPTLTVTLPAPAFATIDASIPGTTVTSTQVTGINDAGHAVGLFKDASGITHVFEDINGTFTPITLPGAPSSTTVAVGINSSDEIVGNFNGLHGFIDTNGTVTPVSVPSALATLFTGVNDSGEIVGIVRDGSVPFQIHGLIDNNGHFTTINVPSSLDPTVSNPQTRAFGINNAGETVGFFQDFNHNFHGFLDINGKFTTIDVPGATLTEAMGINNAGEIVGFFTDASGKDHGFLDNNGKFTTIDVPGATLTHAIGINDANQIVGFFTDSNNVNHGFVLQEPHVSGTEDTLIALPISAGLSPAETDPDSVLTVTINGLPSGVTLVDANHDKLTIANGSATLTAAQLNGLSLISDGGTQHFDLTVTATNTDGGNALTAVSTPSQVIHVDVALATDANPVLLASAAATSVNEDGPVGLNIVAAPGDATITVTGLGAATLNHGTVNADGSVTLQQSDLAGLTLHAGDDDTSAIHLTVTATTNNSGTTVTTAPQTIDLTVNPVPETPTVTASAASSNVAEGGTVALAITPTFESDSDATNTITISGLNGAKLSAGTVNADGSVTLTPAQLAGLTLTAPDTIENLSLHVTATASEGGTSATSAAATVNLAVAPVALQVVQLPGDEAAFNVVSISNDPDATLTSVQIGGFPANPLTETTSFVLTDAHGNVVPLQNVGFTDQAVFTAAQIQAGILNGLQLNLGENTPQTLTLTATSSDGATTGVVTASTFTLETQPAADAPVLTTQAAAGTADIPIHLSVSALTENDPDQTVTITAAGLPSGATLSAGTVNADGSVTLTPAQLAGLTLTSDGSVQHFDLTFKAVASEAGTSAPATQATLHVDVAVATDASPAVFASAAATSVNEDGTVGLNIVAAPADATVTVSGLGTATLNHGTVNADGSVTLQQSDLTGLTLHAADDETSAIHLTVIATTHNGGATVTTAPQTVDLTVSPAPETPTVTASASVNTVQEGGIVGLTITPTFETDADATNTISISGLNGAKLSAGTVNADGSVTLTSAQLAGLTLTAPNTVENLSLHVTATASEGGASATSTTATVNVAVAPVVLEGVQLGGTKPHSTLFPYRAIPPR